MINKQKKKISTVQLFLVLFATLIVGAAIGISSVRNVNAEASGSLNDTGIGVSEISTSGTTKWTISGTSISGTITGESSRCGDSASSSTLRITNNKSFTIDTFSFKYTYSVGGGSAKINNTTISATSKPVTFTVSNLAPGAYFDIVISSGSGSSNKAILNITEILAYSEVKFDLTFKHSEELKYTIKIGSRDLVTIDSTDQTINDILATEQITLTVPSSDTYELGEWKKNGNFVSSSNPYTFYAEADDTYEPYFVPKYSGCYLYNDVRYYSFESVLSALDLKASKNIIVLVSSGAVTGEHTIPSNTTLIIPQDDKYKSYGANIDDNQDDGYTAPTAFKTWTLFSGCSITCDGTIEIVSKISNNQSQGSCGAPSGKCGMIYLSANSSITMTAGSYLYAWGYAYGPGEIHAKDGSTIYEGFQTPCWRGGSMTLSMEGNKDKVFPINSYSVQNIECKLFLYSGCTERVVAINTVASADAKFISKNDGMFHISSGYIVKYFDHINTKLVVETYGNIVLSNFSINVYITMNTSDYVLPLTQILKIVLVTGQISISQDISLYPGCEIIISENAVLTINEGFNLYVFSKDTYDKYSYYGGTFYYGLPRYSVTKGSKIVSDVATYRSTYTSYSATPYYKDAEIDIQGILNIYGNLYTTYPSESSGIGANIHCSRSRYSPSKGRIRILNNLKPTTTITEVIQVGTSYSGSTKDTINCESAYATNGVDSEVAPVQIMSQKELYFDFKDKTPEKGVWVSTDIKPEVSSVKFEDLDGNVIYEKEFTEGKPFVFPTGAEAEFADLNLQYSLKCWVNTIETEYYSLGDDSITSATSALSVSNFKPFCGGWYKEYVQDGDIVHEYNKYCKYESPSLDFATGLYLITNKNDFKTINGISIHANDIVLFQSGTNYFASELNGLFEYDVTSYPLTGDNNYYYLTNGIVNRNYGLVTFDDGYTFYYFGESDYAYADGYFYVSNTNKLTYDDNPIEPGYYYFDSYGVMDVTHTHVEPKSKPTSIDDDGVAYDQNGDVADNYGLFALNGNLYYAAENGVLINSTSFYVSADMINGCTIGNNGVSAGLYYFDDNGRMHDSQLNLITNGGQS